MKEIALWSVGVYVAISLCMSIWLFLRAKVWKFENKTWLRISGFVVLFIAWPILIALIRSDVIEFKADIEEERENND